MSPSSIEVLAICGSLRAASSNRNLLLAAPRVAPGDVNVTMYEGLAELPHFNPDIEEMQCPEHAQQLREKVRNADAILICSPEYAHGVVGALKNALDWLVGSDAPLDKPVAVLNASARSRYADPQLRETLRVMGFRIIETASVTIALDGLKLPPEAIAGHETMGADLRAALDALVEGIG